MGDIIICVDDIKHGEKMSIHLSTHFHHSSPFLFHVSFHGGEKTRVSSFNFKSLELDSREMELKEFQAEKVRKEFLSLD
ncbi:hypothetical protein GQ457_13G014120 [Hibiscus cannabinus]